MFKGKTGRLESRGKIQFYWILGHCGVEVNERAGSEAKKSIEEGRDSKLLLPVADLKAQWEKKENRSFKISVKIPKGTKEKATLKGTTGVARLRGSAR
jgi:hypothetical protein